VARFQVAMGVRLKSLSPTVFASISVSTRACHARKLGSTPRQRVILFSPTQ
jgi:hypothetical protein